MYDQKYQKSYKRAFPPVSATPTHTLRVCVNSSLLYISPLVASRRPVRTKCPDRPAIAEPWLQVRNAQAPTRIHCCAISGYGKPRGSKFGCVSACEHSEIKVILIVSSAYKLPHARQPYYAGVQTMRARICSASSCDMFARVVV